MEASKPKVKRPAESARCLACGSNALSNLPTFSLGCGISVRAIADDVYCGRCGHMGPPAYSATYSPEKTSKPAAKD